MKVAIVAVGELARYFVEELTEKGHTVVTISRNRKSYLDDYGITQHLASDYAASDLDTALADCDAAICTLRGGIANFASIHKAVLEACKRSATCKRFIPSAWAGNLEEFPDEPLDWAAELQAVFAALRSQDDVSWTAICPGWYADYIIPRSCQRYLGDIGDMWPQNYAAKTFTLYGNGGQLVNLTAARDTARATIMLLAHDRREWEEYTYVSGVQVSWRQLAEFVRCRDGAYAFRRKSLAESVRGYVASETPQERAVAVFEIWGHSEALHFPWEKVIRHRSKYFQGLEFRGLGEVMDEADRNPERVV
jgi:nucleoside-diphosphate-sugar epimerase